MKNIWIKHKLLIIIIVFLTLLFLVIFFLAVPMANGIKNKADDIQRRNIDNEINKNRIGKIPEMEEMDKVIQSKEKYLDVILDPNNEFEFIKKLEALADETGNKMTIRVDDPGIANSAKTAKTAKTSANNKKNENDIRENLAYDSYIFMEINLTGGYQGLVNFIHKLENLDYYTNIISVDSKKVTEVLENEAAPSQNINPFVASESAAKTQKKEKDMIKSVLSVVVYTKK